MRIAGYGWVRDLPDHRDRYWLAPPLASAELPAAVDLRPQCPPVYDQGQLGSCTANAIAGAVQFDEIRSGIAPTWTPSRLFIYYNERVLEGTVASDSGAQLRDGIKAIAADGVCPETDWPYDISRFAERPPQQAFSDAVRDRVGSYQRVTQSLAQLKTCIASRFTFVFGFTVFSSFESPEVARTGVIPLPQPSESPVGGHAVVCVGYDDARSAFIIRNSWGAGWGEAGYGHMPYAYVLDAGLAADFWTIRAAPGGAVLRARHTGSASQRAEDDD
ncbi:MAG TPA: C1 family peptidase [Candidatus Dormibacteraeota bacterium]|nr:C1 family peptidase [Candidatus Dormibacteraeota bacterium]